MLRDDEVSEAVGLSRCDGRLERTLFPGGTLPLGGPAEAGRRLRFWWNKLRRTDVEPIVSVSQLVSDS